LEVDDLILPGLLRGLAVGGGERPTGAKSKLSLSEAAAEGDRRENALLLGDRSSEFSRLASSLATSAADNMGCGVYSEVDRAEVLVASDPVSSQKDDCGAAFEDAQGLRWKLRSERRL
jgi:hypothetical protein